MPRPRHRPRDRDPGISQPSPEQGRTAATRQAGARAIKNTAYRSGGEIVGRLASLALFVVAARSLGQNGLGAFVFALAFLGVVLLPVSLGYDSYMLRAIARERSAENHLFFNILSLKLTLAVPLVGLSFLGLSAAGYSGQIQATSLALAVGVFSDSIARTQQAVFAAHERNGPPALADSIQRVLSAGLGIAVLKTGHGVVAMGAAYSAGSLIGVLIGFVLLARTIGMPARTVGYRAWRSLAMHSVPFAAQDVASTLLARVDMLILSLIATQAAVGRYGAAYRLFESTLFLTWALVGAFSAMYTYLGADTTPSLSAVFQRSIKLSLALLVPVSVAFAVLARPICRLIYGAGFTSAAVPLRILAPAVALISIITLTISLLLSRENARRVAPVTAVMVVVNVVLNLILIPRYNDAGAAAALLATEVIFVVSIMRMAAPAVGRIAWLRVAAGALAGGAAMAAVALVLHDSLIAALAAGGAVYLVVGLAVERLVSPLDVAFVASLVRRRLPSRPTG